MALRRCACGRGVFGPRAIYCRPCRQAEDRRIKQAYEAKRRAKRGAKRRIDPDRDLSEPEIESLMAAWAVRLRWERNQAEAAVGRRSPWAA